MNPNRIQRRRTKGWRAPEGAVYVGRPTRFGNPARLIHVDNGLIVQWGTNGGVVGTWPTGGAEARRFATELYASWINRPEQADTRALFRALLHGRDLTCWCPLDQPCHADVLLAIANETTP
ncbi:hypothetical protein DV517_61840 [Streptomyces sp. S816]|uniref:DUF4326 domain-containing protein n=1 Tax=Streptomyces sp. S816 TaxID=2283197 RepID=UPI00109C84BD|nr:DUF4326 domain-containing protein [Streptomyces sp. S816]TGZ14701.1 hypothetical protein DV517_61840 [Streptomyces sp. S816]